MRCIFVLSIVFLGYLAVACTPIIESPEAERDRVAKMFVQAALSADELEIAKYIGNADQTTKYISGITRCFDFSNSETSSRLVGTPTPAERANGLGEQFDYSASFAFRHKATNEKWMDGVLRFRMTFVSGKWTVAYLHDLFPRDCR